MGDDTLYYARLQELNDPRRPEEPLCEDEAEAVYRALEVAKVELRRIRDRAKYAGGAWSSYAADDGLAKVNDIMKGAR